jgi:hypothetical protein
MFDEFFEWATCSKGLSLTVLADRLGYSLRHVYRIRDGKVQRPVSFSARAVAAFGDDVRKFFPTKEMHP